MLVECFKRALRKYVCGAQQSQLISTNGLTKLNLTNIMGVKGREINGFHLMCLSLHIMVLGVFWGGHFIVPTYLSVL